MLCNQCGKFSSGFDAVMWLRDVKFQEALSIVANELGIEPKAASQNGKPKRQNGEDANPAAHLEFQAWNDLSIAYWCLTKPPVTVAAVRLCGGRIARWSYYDQKFMVLALPVWGEKLTAADPVGWCIYNITGHHLPGKDKPKLKLTYGSSRPGYIGPVDQLAGAKEVWKLEGPSDLLAFYSLPDVPPGVVAVTNKAGAGEKPAKWQVEMLAEKVVRVLHDADKAGEEGAEKWLSAVSLHASETWWMRLPYDVGGSHGKDLRDYLKENGDGTH